MKGVNPKLFNILLLYLPLQFSGKKVLKNCDFFADFFLNLERFEIVLQSFDTYTFKLFRYNTITTILHKSVSSPL